MKRFILGAVAALNLLGNAGISLAAQWVYVAESSDDTSYYVDFDSIKGIDSNRTFWARKLGDYGKTESLMKISLDCAAKRMSILKVISYNSDGSVNPYRSFEDPYFTMSEIAPSTIGDAYHQFICSRITAQPPVEKYQARQLGSEYPKAACGDVVPSTPGTYNLYPVFTDYSPGTLHFIVNNLCRDAFQIRRENGQLSIQVASFTSISRAVDFASLIEERIGSSEVGEPTIVRR